MQDRFLTTKDGREYSYNERLCDAYNEVMVDNPDNTAIFTIRDTLDNQVMAQISEGRFIYLSEDR